MALALEHADEYPHALVERMRELGLFGALVPAEHGGLGLTVSTYARVIEELCRGWMSLAGVINSHTMAALIVLHQGTDEQRRRLLPRFAAGTARGGLCLTEPHAGSDVQAIQTTARRDGDRYLISGSKMFVTNGREGNSFALLARTDTAADPPHRGMSCFIVEKGAPGLEVVKSIAKLGYKGVDTAELVFDRFPEYVESESSTADDLIRYILQYRDVLDQLDETIGDDFPLWDIVERFDNEQKLADELLAHKQRTGEVPTPADSP